LRAEFTAVLPLLQPALTNTEIANKLNPMGIGDCKRLRGAGAVILALAVMALAYSTMTLAQNNDTVKAGLAMWKTTGCADCHGPFADGDREDDDFPIGANLRTSKLDAAALRTTIRCGRAGTGMPSFDEGAYTTRECYGRPQVSRPGNLQPTPRTLSLDEIDAVIAYLQARIIGRGKITREECLSYYEDQPDTCEDYK
jgi:mono/diheme cytochrome c family protein